MTTFGTTLAQCGIGNGEPTLAQRSKLRFANVVNLRWANSAAYVGPTLLCYLGGTYIDNIHYS